MGQLVRHEILLSGHKLSTFHKIMGWQNIQMSVKTSYGFYEVFIAKAFWVPRLFSWWVASGKVDGSAFLRVPRGSQRFR